jgi:hypothetical protein
MQIECLNIEEKQNGKNLGSSKEMVDTWNLVVDLDGELISPITVRCYMGRSSSASVVYASVWIGDRTLHTSGHGQAGGYGYCKVSAAIDNAFRSAGVELNKSISGVGTRAVESAIVAIGKYLFGKRKMILIHN